MVQKGDPLFLSETRFRTFFEQATLPMELCSLDGSRIISNQAWEKLFAASPEELKSYNLFRDPNLRPHLDLFRRAYAGEVLEVPPFLLDPAKLAHSDRARWLKAYLFPVKDEKGSVQELAIILNDVTDQKAADDELLRSRDQFRFALNRLDLVLRSVDVGIWYTDHPFKELHWDEKMKEHFGLSPSDPLTVETFFDRVHPQDRRKLEKAIEEALFTHEPYSMEFRTFDPTTHNTRWIRAVGRTFFDPISQRALRFDGITIDISEQKLVEESLKRTASAAEAAVRARDEFFSIASHELRTPLTSMKLQVQSLQRALDRDKSEISIERIQKTVDQSDRQINRLTRLVDDMLDISRINSGRFKIQAEKADFGDMIRDFIDRITPQFESLACNLVCEIEARDYVYWDRYRVEQVLLNLLTNAAKYGAGLPIRINIRSWMSHVQMSIEDKGLGIAPENHARIFQRFERAEHRSSEISGLGLGLYIVKQIVEMHHGTISVDSRLGEGARFIIALPRNPFGLTAECKMKEIVFRETRGSEGPSGPVLGK